MANCLPILIAFMLFSIAVAAWGYHRARKLHFRIEAAWPGFNEMMRDFLKHRHK